MLHYDTAVSAHGGMAVCDANLKSLCSGHSSPSCLLYLQLIDWRIYMRMLLFQYLQVSQSTAVRPCLLDA